MFEGRENNPRKISAIKKAEEGAFRLVPSFS